jgi:Mg2+-importing ATPase
MLYANMASSYAKTNRNQGNRAFEETLFSELTESEKEALQEYKRIEEFPFDPERKRASSVMQHNGKLEIVVRGAPEEILELVAHTQKIDKKDIQNWISEKGKKGVRVLAIAKRTIEKDETGNVQKLESDLELLGFIGFLDPIKKTTPDAIKKAKLLGVQVKIVTGDSPEVAGAVAFETGLIDTLDMVITGSAFEKLDSNEQHEAVKKYHVFARVTPSQKYKIIELLREHFQVGFLGEGINDAPALKASNVGLVVNDASDIARDASDVVLLDKSLSVIIDGIREGRAVFANTNKYITATLSSNFGNFFAVAIVSLIIDFLPMLPLQILLVNLLSDFPMISIATDSVDPENIETPSKYSIKNFAFIALLKYFQ